ncbi:hypothetical protein EmuJ_000272700 [Echinococcus multilocularis]|uniref:Uncharacterized protein n=1 Tax=Echinococcus multilocularis TaxID=6211 RepID=A0A068XT54_ECHMU|nr:hypothetical protein EmuJ_000272700 [Echinococcus multilocularis]
MKVLSEEPVSESWQIMAERRDVCKGTLCNRRRGLTRVHLLRLTSPVDSVCQQTEDRQRSEEIVLRVVEDLLTVFYLSFPPISANGDMTAAAVNTNTDGAQHLDQFRIQLPSSHPNFFVLVHKSGHSVVSYVLSPGPAP